MFISMKHQIQSAKMGYFGKGKVSTVENVQEIKTQSISKNILNKYTDFKQNFQLLS